MKTMANILERLKLLREDTMTDFRSGGLEKDESDKLFADIQLLNMAISNLELIPADSIVYKNIVAK